MPVRDGGYASIVLRAAAALALVAWVAEGAAEWPTFRADIGRTGRAEQALSENPSVLWACDLGGSVDGSPVVLDQRVFVGNSHGRFACVAAADGKLLWDTHLDGAVCSAAAADGQRIVVGTSRGFLYCLSPGGKMLWRLHCWDAVVASPLILGDRCFWGSMDGVLHCAALASGQELWTCQLSGGISAAPASDGKVIFVADEAGDIWAIRPSDGSIVWRYQSECPAMAAPV
ncbi:MAG: PQQ-like beta-propeller repeat protein, partial [Armatimonadetes bacterium]|nr:PQQ-like beta-propeller repeat protein [Armatimonadota bacterium]